MSSQPNRSRIITRGQFNPDLVAANNRAVYADRTLYDHFTIDVFKGDYPTLTDIATLRAAMRQVMPQRAVGHTDQYQFPKLEGFNHGGITASGLLDTGVWDVHTYPESDDTTPERPFAAVDLLLFDEEKTRQEVRQRVAEAFRTNMLVVNAHNLLKGKNTYRLEPVLPQ